MDVKYGAKVFSASKLIKNSFFCIAFYDAIKYNIKHYFCQTEKQTEKTENRHPSLLAARDGDSVA
jgi:hypothetical protein